MCLFSPVKIRNGPNAKTTYWAMLHFCAVHTQQIEAFCPCSDRKFMQDRYFVREHFQINVKNSLNRTSRKSQLTSCFPGWFPRAALHGSRFASTFSGARTLSAWSRFCCLTVPSCSHLRCRGKSVFVAGAGWVCKTTRNLLCIAVTLLVEQTKQLQLSAWSSAEHGPHFHVTNSSNCVCAAL
jgi:hypothetical protein